MSGDIDSMKERLSWCYEKEECNFTSPKHAGEPRMLYLAIDQHRKQLTVTDRNEKGDATVKRQVSTKRP